MKAADGIRQVCNEKDVEELSISSTATTSWSADVDDRRYYPKHQFPPGTIEGVAAAVVGGGLFLTPFRSAVLRQVSSPHSSPGFRNLVDLIVTPLLAVGAAQVGLAAASLVGSRVYLEEAASVPPTAISPMSDLICDDLLLLQKEKGANQQQESVGYSSRLAESWDPRTRTINSLHRAMSACHERQQLRQDNGNGLTE